MCIHAQKDFIISGKQTYLYAYTHLFTYGKRNSGTPRDTGILTYNGTCMHTDAQREHQGTHIHINAQMHGLGYTR